jgi:hypothetical protein
MFKEKTTRVAVLGAAGAAAALAIRPLALRWGAADSEVEKAWPGDELTPRPATQATRAVTIHAPAAAVWPWILQIGQDRGGFYSYTWLENLVGARIRNVDRIVPEFQQRQVGDTVWMAPQERYGGKGCARIARLEPERAMVLVTPDDMESAETKGFAPQGTWAFLLDPLAEATTRLILRTRSGQDPNLFKRLFDFLVYDPAHFIMERKMMLGIKKRAEAACSATP